MKKIAIEILDIDELLLYSIAKEFQPFIIEGDYAIDTIVKKLLEKERIELDISMNRKMPEFERVVERLDEEEITYQLYRRNEDGEWESSDYYSLGIDRTPKWQIIIVGIAMISYVVVSFFEIFAIYDWYNFKYELEGLFGVLLSIITAYIPFVGSLLAYWSATELWQWSSLTALTLYFFYYLPLIWFLLYIVWVVLKALYQERWYRFWYPEFK